MILCEIGEAVKGAVEWGARVTAPHAESIASGGGEMKVEGDAVETWELCCVVAAAEGFLVFDGVGGVGEYGFRDRDEGGFVKEDEAGCGFARKIIGWVGAEAGKAARGRRDGERLNALFVSWKRGGGCEGDADGDEEEGEKGLGVTCHREEVVVGAWMGWCMCCSLETAVGLSRTVQRRWPKSKIGEGVDVSDLGKVGETLKEENGCHSTQTRSYSR